MIEWVTKWSKAENKEVVEMRYVADVLFPEVSDILNFLLCNNCCYFRPLSGQ